MHWGLLAPNTPNALALVLAAQQNGAVLVPLNTRLTAAELAYQLQLTDCERLWCVPETRQLACQAAAGLAVAVWLLPWPGECIQAALGVARLPLPQPDLAAIVLTSGTTGRPKAAMLTWANLRASADASAARLGAFTDDRWLLTLPLYHVGGLSIIYRALWSGFTVEPLPRFDLTTVQAACASTAPTLISLVPTMLTRLLAAGWTAASLRLLLLGGAAASSSLCQQALAAGLPLALTYGLTEACSQVATALPAEVATHPQSVGKPLAGYTIAVRAETGQSLPANTPGELYLQSPAVFAGYYRDPAATAAVLQAGWLRTGDWGLLDDIGRLQVLDRRTDLIVSGGENVYPSEVENALLQHPSVQACCVVGLTDAEWGQRVAAGVVLTPDTTLTAQDLQGWLRQHLAGYKLPRQIFFLTALPLTATGKVARQVVRADLQNRLAVG
jgi:O-succinylbenzoic acid--CoA ligase